MPVFLWKEKMRRENKDAFKELMKLIAKRQNEDQGEVDNANFGERVKPDSISDCLFCADEFNSKSAFNRHLLVCSKKPEGLFQCNFCGNCFDTDRGRTTHLNTCSEKHETLPEFECLF